ncbi:MAG TPA: class I SAM-dependent methyltransferase [Thermoanaerobaculia bacterium]|nr:class I SAM-dependent methyltransferase [Thermoanaerobaculia bacterium]
MNPEEYERLAAIDRDHWFYRGKREIVRHWIDRCVELGRDDLLVDAGCGTGTFLVEMAERCRVLGLDDFAESLAIARPRVGAVGGEVLQTGLDRVDLADGCATVVTLLDVLEHLDDDAGALAEMLRLVRPGGIVVITVPALRWLWSDWDEALHHRRRYHRADLRALCGRSGAELLHLAYFNALALPAIAVVRASRRVLRARARDDAERGERMEDRIPPLPLNGLLRVAMVVPARWRLGPPVGVSLLAVLRRTAP